MLWIILEYLFTGFIGYKYIFKVNKTAGTPVCGRTP